MSHYIAICASGELRRARIVKPGNGTLYSSPSAARAGIAKYTGPEHFEVFAKKPISPPGRPTEMQDGRRHNIYIADADWDRLTALGEGNASKGLRIALDK